MPLIWVLTGGYSVERARAAGFMESIPTIEGFKTAFDYVVQVKLVALLVSCERDEAVKSV